MFTLLQAHIQVDVVGRVNYYRKLALDDCRGQRYNLESHLELCRRYTPKSSNTGTVSKNHAR